ncbi:disintegrin and metalloproteinase domain-containing protein 9-like [Maylandia zebra]|uniref:disintegrin and metalloproteinase domain-containing protein 9-like n=1 Tax=Maylandia zebra TaxID=106582 RepID=UPI00403CFF30
MLHVFHGVSKYSIVNPQMIHRWSRSINSPRHSKEKYGDETLSYAVTIDNKKHVLHLKKNRDFLHSNFVQYLRDATGNYDTSYPANQVHCYYHGEVEGYKNSLVAVSTCSGLSSATTIWLLSPLWWPMRWAITWA